MKKLIWILALVASVAQADSYSIYGDSIYGDDGSSATTYGNTVYGSDGTTCTAIGNQVYCN